VALGATLVAALCALALVIVTVVPGMGVTPAAIPTASAAADAVNPRLPVAVAGADDLPAPTTEDPELGTVASYRVDETGALSPHPPVDATFFWDIMVRAVGADEAAARFHTLEVSNAPRSDLAAYVIRDTRTPYRWTLGVNTTWNTDVMETLLTAVHEYGHVLSLDSAEVPPGGTSSCDTVYVAEGCALDDSYLALYHAEFWSSYDDAPEPDNVSDSITDEFYDDNEEDFVSRYAATNVVEDFAESFAVFVVDDIPDDDTVTARKIRFFTDYPEFLEFRDRVRAEFALD